MLTKDLLRFRLMNNAIKPSFVKTDDPALLEFAASLIGIYEGGAGEKRCALEEKAEQITSSINDLKLSRGLNKIALDRCEFSVCADADYPTLRKAVFSRTFGLLKKNSYESADAFHAAVFDGSAKELGFLKEGLYADLPDNERLTSLKKLFPKELLERYNCSLAQSLLLYCSRIDATVEEPDPANMRRLFKYLKFFRLLARIELSKEDAAKEDGATEVEPQKIELRIDGPASIFDASSKYGLQLACFLPALIQVKKWEIDCEVKMRDRKLRLRLDQDSGLVSHYSNFSAYVPEEVGMFHRLFKEKVEDWKIAGGTPFIKTDDGQLIFPDFTFEGPKGVKAHLELFHKWHAAQLPARLEFCGKRKKLNLLLGVDRSLLSDASLKTALESSKYFEKRGFLFRDFPGVETTKNALELLLK